MNRVVNKYPIKNFYQQILGYIEEDADGNQRGRDFHNRIIGTYDKKLNTTRDFYGRIVGQGNMLSGMIMANK